MVETLLQLAKKGKMSPVVKRVAKIEGIDAKVLLKKIALGRVVIMQRKEKSPVGFGEGLKTKVNANIGTSAESVDPKGEVQKAKIAEKYGADTVTDLSMGGPIDKIRKKIAENTNSPLTTVPIYQTVIEKGSFKGMTEKDLIDMIRKHVDEGISSLVIHAGFTKAMLKRLRGQRRILGMVSKGGSFTSAWMLKTGKENPFLTNFDEICKILASRDVVLSLGNTMRSGCTHDFMDSPQKGEIELNAKLAKRANKFGVQVIIEGMGGHVSPDRIPEYVRIYKKITGYRPLFVAGPMPIEIGVGHDHISGSIGGAIASGAGADYLCYITPSEHLSLPNLDQVREGIVAFKIAAHVGDTLKFGPRPQDKELARLRKVRDWEGQFKLAIDGDRAREIHPQTKSRTCSMCGKFCAIAIMEKYLR
jgi:phosphomethylpyrimidine synthase